MTRFARRFAWNLFLTGTFRHPTGLSAAHAVSSRFLAEWGLSLDLMAALWALEPHEQTLQGMVRYHVHMLLSRNFVWRTRNCGGPSRNCGRRCREFNCWRDVRSVWDRQHGFATVFPVSLSDPGVMAYVLKYVLKGTKADNATFRPTEREHTPDVSWGMWTNPRAHLDGASGSPVEYA